MKKVLNVVYGLLIAIWPVLFILGMDYFEYHINGIVSHTYSIWYSMFLLAVYTVAGLVFAAIGYYQKESINRAEKVGAHVVAAILVVTTTFLYLLGISGVVVPHTIILNSRPLLLAFVLGYTLYTAVKAVTIYKKTTVHTRNEAR